MEWIFTERKAWADYTLKKLKKLASGTVGICWSVIGGILSVIVWVWKKMTAFVGAFPHVSLGAFFFIVFVVWLVMFAKNRALVNGLESQRDTISYEYQTFKRAHGYE